MILSFGGDYIVCSIVLLNGRVRSRGSSNELRRSPCRMLLIFVDVAISRCV